MLGRPIAFKVQGVCTHEPHRFILRPTSKNCFRQGMIRASDQKTTMLPDDDVTIDCARVLEAAAESASSRSKNQYGLFETAFRREQETR